MAGVVVRRLMLTYEKTMTLIFLFQAFSKITQPKFPTTHCNLDGICKQQSSTYVAKSFVVVGMKAM